jgi:hypothetical protein
MDTNMYLHKTVASDYDSILLMGHAVTNPWPRDTGQRSKGSENLLYLALSPPSNLLLYISIVPPALAPRAAGAG